MTAIGSRHGLGRRAVVGAAALFAVLAGAASAHSPDFGPDTRPDADPVRMTVIDRETGRRLPFWPHHGRLFVAGEAGARYAIRLDNRTDGRVLVVLSVDGLNAITGQSAAVGQGGYVLPPWSSFDVTGWRKSNTEVAAFAFTPLSRSYAARTGRPSDVGVIGMAVFGERRPPLIPQPQPQPPLQPLAAPAPIPESPPLEAEDATATRGFTLFSGPPAPRAAVRESVAAPPPPPAKLPAPSMSSLVRRPALAIPREERLGTAHGAREPSVVFETVFARATSEPALVRRIDYDTRANLVAAGVIPAWPPAPPRPRPFPGDADPRFAPDPPGLD